MNRHIVLITPPERCPATPTAPMFGYLSGAAWREYYAVQAALSALPHPKAGAVTQDVANIRARLTETVKRYRNISRTDSFHLIKAKWLKENTPSRAIGAKEKEKLDRRATLIAFTSIASKRAWKLKHLRTGASTDYTPTNNGARRVYMDALRQQIRVIRQQRTQMHVTGRLGIVSGNLRRLLGQDYIQSSGGLPTLSISAINGRVAGRRILADYGARINLREGVNYVGVELECYVRDLESLHGKMVQAGLDRWVRSTTDGSLGSGMGEGREFRFCAPVPEFERPLTMLCKLIQEHKNPKATSNVDHTCGTHVHLDCRNRSFEKVADNLYSAQDLLAAMVPVARRENTYCKLLTRKPTDWRSHMRDRYYAINTNSYDRHRTVEMRLHSGTVDAKKIINWIKILEAFANMAETPKRFPATLAGVQRITGLSDEIMAYIKERIKRFNDPNNPSPYIEEAPRPRTAPVSAERAVIEAALRG